MIPDTLDRLAREDAARDRGFVEGLRAGLDRERAAIAADLRKLAEEIKAFPPDERLTPSWHLHRAADRYERGEHGEHEEVARPSGAVTVEDIANLRARERDEARNELTQFRAVVARVRAWAVRRDVGDGSVGSEVLRLLDEVKP